MYLLETVVVSETRKIGSGRADPTEWLDNDVYEAFDQRILPVDARVARLAASLHVPDPAPVSDALIAATALATNMVMVTRNIRDFGRFEGLEVLNPWNYTTE